MILRECLNGVKQVFTLLDISSEYDTLFFDRVADEINTMLRYLDEIGIDVFLAEEKYFPPLTRGIYHSKENKLFLNKTFMRRPSALISVMRHEGYHAAQDCMAGTIDNSFIAIIEPEENVPKYWQELVNRSYANSPESIPWEKEATWAGHTENMTLDALAACASDTPMWEIYDPTPLTRKWLKRNGYINE